MDNTLQRVILANSSILSEATHAEIQLPDSWNDTNISFKLNLGSFKNGNNNSLYLFVFDNDGITNTAGIQLCADCWDADVIFTNGFE